MRKTIAALALTVAAPISVAAVAVPAHAAVHAPVSSMKDTNWPCAGC